MPEKKTHEQVIAEYWATQPTPEQQEIVRKVQASIRRWVPEGVPLADELIAERRAEAARE